MNLLELLGIFFLAVLIINIAIGVWAIKTTFFTKKDEDVEAYN